MGPVVPTPHRATLRRSERRNADGDRLMPGFLHRLFGGRNDQARSTPSARPSPSAEQPARRRIEATLYSGHETLEVVGESHYQETLWDVVGGRRSEPVRYESVALLIPDPENPYDPNAIEVRIDGLLVGHLSREDAAAYRPGLIRLMQDNATPLVALHAAIVGGGRRNGRVGYLGVFLDHDPADFGLQPHDVITGQRRTGLSEAARSDESAEMAWYRDLPDDEQAAIERLRSLLDDESDPFCRHYMFAELERRLYHSRSSVPSALDEFDAVCERHHTEMDVIRPALIGRYGAVPLIEMYRQASIRYQKAKLWGSAQEWAQRGVDVYADEPARPEAVEDLRRREMHATSKLEEPSRPRRKPTTRPVATGELQTETLICADCGAAFERVIVRGRKPRTCPGCRGEREVAITR